jgi:E3 ubiquitin-protein ligase RFWD2
VVNEPTEVHCPVVEMATRSKLSYLSWNKYSKNIIASSDYEGIVTVWDANTRQVQYTLINIILQFSFEN